MPRQVVDLYSGKKIKMYRFFVEKLNEEKLIIRDKVDIEHAMKALRLKEGGEVECVYIDEDNSPYEYIASISHIDKNKIILEKIKQVHIGIETGYNIKVYQGIPKAQKIEIIAQNITQAGAKELTAVIFERCIKKDVKDNQIKRIQRILKDTAMQSKRLLIPSLKPVIKFDDLLKELSENDINILCYEDEKKTTIKEVLLSWLANLNCKKYSTGCEYIGKNIGLIIGTEGGITQDEVNHLKEVGCKCVSLGNRIFRTEIAGACAIAMINYELEL